MKFLFKLTTRSRPQRAIKALESIYANITTDNFQILITLDSDDPTTPEIFEWSAGKFDKITIGLGTSLNKIDAINRDLNNLLIKWDVLVNVSDDQVFIKQGFDEVIVQSLNGNLDLFLHFPDGNQKDLATMSIMGYDYYMRDKYIYHPSYQSVYCDNEAQDVAKLRGCYKYVNEDILVHEHPAWGKAQYDYQYAKTEHPTIYMQDEANYKKRKNENFNN